MTPKPRLKVGKTALSFLVLFLCMTSVGSVWMFELSMVAINNGGILTNGFWDFNAMQIYHLSMYTMLMSIIVLGSISMYYIINVEARA